MESAYQLIPSFEILTRGIIDLPPDKSFNDDFVYHVCEKYLLVAENKIDQYPEAIIMYSGDGACIIKVSCKQPFLPLKEFTSIYQHFSNARFAQSVQCEINKKELSRLLKLKELWFNK